MVSVDLPLVRKLAGHSDPVITSADDRRGPRARRDAVAQLDLPR